MPGDEIYNVILNTAEAEASIQRLLTLLEQAQLKAQQPIAMTATGAGGEQVPTQFAQFREQLNSFQQDATKYQAMVQQISTAGGTVSPQGAQQFAAMSASITDATQKLQGYLALSKEQLAQPATPVVPPAT